MKDRFFKAITFMGRELEFRVTEDNEIISESFSFNVPIKRLILKPNLEFICEGRIGFDLDGIARSTRSVKDLVQYFIIDEDLLLELVSLDKIRYSTDMAFLYGFNPDFAYDRRENTRAFKHVKDESKILSLQKRGIFN